MASEQQCADALHELAQRMDANRGDSPVGRYTRTLSATLSDLGVVFVARLHDGRLEDLRTVASPDAQIRLVMASDMLLDLVGGRVNVASAWATGKIKIHAGVRDLLRLRSMF